MKKSPLTLALLALSLAASLSAAQPVGQWTPGKDEHAVADSVRGNSLSLVDGVSLVADAKAPGGRALSFSGAQTKPVISTSPVAGANPVVIKLAFCPGGGSADRQTVVSYAGCYELRYTKSRGILEFIVFLPEKKYSIVKVAVPAGKWTAVTASFANGTQTLEGGKASASGSTKGVMPEVRDAMLRLGFAPDRPFGGLVGELSISTP